MTREAGRPRPRMRRVTVLLLCLGAGLIVVLGWSAIGGPGWDSSPQLPQPPPLPTPNGYDDVLAAGRAIEKSGLTGAKFDLEKMDKPAIQAVVDGSLSEIALGRKALEKPFQVPVVYNMDAMMNVTLKDVGAIRGGLVRAMRAQEKLAAIEGRTDDAAGICTDVIRLGAAMSHGVPMIAYLVSVAVESGGLHDLRDLRDKLSPQQCRELIALLEEIEAKGELPRDVTNRETAFMNANLKKMGFFAGISMRVSGVHAKGLKQMASSVATVQSRVAASRRILLTDLALRVYRNEHGDAPPDLDALVPAILKSVPLDPYTGKPLRYLKQGKFGTVYSVGPDRDDDKAANPLPVRHTDTTDGDFTIDSF